MSIFKRVLVLLFLIGVARGSSQSVNLPLNHWIYKFLERMETRGIISNIRDGSKPFSRDKIASFILPIEDKKQLLSNVEREYLNRMRAEFTSEPHIYSWTGKAGHIHADALMGGDSRAVPRGTPEGRKYSFSPYYGGILRGKLWNAAFYSDNRIHAEFSNQKFIESYKLSKSYPRNASSDSSMATWDESQSYIVVKLKGFRLQFGRDRINWGPGRTGGLMLSGLGPCFDMFKASFDLKQIGFTFLHGELRSDYGRKWFAAKRLEISLMRGLDIGLQESIIYGNRNLEGAYLNPLFPLLISEHTLGDHDNVGMGLDFDLNRFRNLRFYGELFIDDMVAPWEIFSDYWSNKLAFTIGGSLLNAFTISNSLLSAEYIRLDPFVYTHKNRINTYENYNIGMGMKMQPNSDKMIFLFEKMFSFKLSMSLQFITGRRGKGDRINPHLITDSKRKEFLEGIVEKMESGSININWEIKRDCRLQMGLYHHKYENYDRILNNNRNFWEIITELNLNW